MAGQLVRRDTGTWQAGGVETGGGSCAEAEAEEGDSEAEPPKKRSAGCLIRGPLPPSGKGPEGRAGSGQPGLHSREQVTSLLEADSAVKGAGPLPPA